jgi:hypothetical protein
MIKTAEEVRIEWENKRHEALYRQLNPPGQWTLLSNMPLCLKPGTLPNRHVMQDRNLLAPIGTLTPRQSDSMHGRFTKCRRVKGGFRVTKRYVIWS